MTGYPSVDALMRSPQGEAATRFQIFDVDGEPLPAERLPGRRALAARNRRPILVRFRAGPDEPDRLSEVGPSRYATPPARCSTRSRSSAR